MAEQHPPTPPHPQSPDPKSSVVAQRAHLSRDNLEKPLTARMQRLLTGQPIEEVILDPDNPNLILERRGES